jgi:hypothetical protein
MPIQEGGRWSPEQNIVSPGVFTRENDLSGLAQGVANIGGAIVAPFADGPAFFPNIITDVPTLEQRFGLADGVYYGPYTAKEYLIQQGIVTVVRVGGLTGYWQKNPLIVYAEPGYWDRNNDVGALTTGSFMYLNSDNYTANIQYVHSSSGWEIEVDSTTSGSPDDDDSYGVNVTATLTTKTQVLNFIGSYSYLPNINDLSSSLGQALNARKLVSVTTTNAFSAFSASVVANNKKVTPLGGGSDYTIAWFDVQKFIPSGSLYFSGSTTQQDSASIDSSINGTYTGGEDGTFSWPANSGSYLTASITVTNNQVNWPFVFLKTQLPSNDPQLSVYAYSRADGDEYNLFNPAFAYDNSYLSFNGDINAKFGDAKLTSDYPETYDGTGALSGSQLYGDMRLNLGTVTTGRLVRKFDGINLTGGAAGWFYLTSSAQGTQTTEETQISTAINESLETKSLLSSSVLNIGTTDQISLVYDKNTIVATGNLSVNSASFATVRTEETCGASLRFIGIVSGKYGPFSTTFVSVGPAGSDPCNPDPDSRKNMVLAVLANTQNASTQFDNNYSVYGFANSSIAQLTSSVYPYKGQVNPNENEYQLALRYNFTTPDGATSSGTYGYYNFSFEENANNYIKEVFGTDATVGNPSKQVQGQKIEAAYSYALFEDSIKRFLAEKTRSNDEGGGWRIQVATAPSAGFSVGESMKFVDEFSYDPNRGDSQFAITNAKTPWIYSQAIAPFKGSADESSNPTKFKLFKVHTISDGSLSNKKYKIEISNVKLAGTVTGSDWGSFTLSVRAYSDTDRRPKYLEIFQNLNLDPDSANFVARRIGDRYAYITFSGKLIEFGTYTNLSKYIRIEMTDIPYPTSVVPYGFEAYRTPVDGTLGNLLPKVRYSKASIYGLSPGKYPSGTVFGDPAESAEELAYLYPTSSFGVGVASDTKNWFSPLPFYGGNDQDGDNIDFDLEAKVWGHAEASYYAQGVSSSTGSILPPQLSGSIPSTYDPVNEPIYSRLRKFVVGFQGGFDGQWPAIPINVGSDITAGNTQGLDCTTIKSPGSIAYKQCIAALNNSDEWDINLVVLPGIFCQQHSYVTNLTINMCESRGDCFYIMDNVVFPASNQSVGLIDAAVNSVSTIDSNYVATYYPWVKILDANLNKIVSVPPSVVLPAIYASSDNSAAEWYAPAGLNRGGIPQAVQVLDRLTHQERDVLYENRVNPIAAFPGQGICVWGQKTLQIAPSALDRVNVRRLLINLKKFIASSSNFLVFEQNIASTRNRFLSIVNPYLESVQQRNGIFAYQVKMDAENNTPDLIDRNILYGQIFIQPTRTSEFILLDFNILPTGGAIFS